MQLLRCRDDTGRVKMLETIAQTITMPIAPFIKARHAVTFPCRQMRTTKPLRITLFTHTFLRNARMS